MIVGLIVLILQYFEEIMINDNDLIIIVIIRCWTRKIYIIKLENEETSLSGK